MPQKKQNIKKKLLTRDRTISILSSDGLIRASITKNTDSVSQAQKRHALDYISASLLARQISAASLCASFLKGEERIIIEIQGSGPIKYIYSEALSIGEVRGFVELRKKLDTENINSFRDAVGIGLFKLCRIVYNKNIPVEGIIPIQKGDIASDLAHYFNQSEQIPSAVSLDVKLSDEGDITQSAGILIQAMPGADIDLLKEIASGIGAEGFSLCSLFAKDYSAEDVLNIVLPFDFSVTRNIQTDFFCRCSLENFKSKLIALGAQEIQDMKDKKQNELVCRYCNEKYYLSDNDFTELLSHLQVTSN